MQPGIEVDKSQILPLRGREGFCRRTHAGHPIQLFVRASNDLAADAGTSDEEIARSVGVSGSTVYRTKRRFVEGNLERALSEEMRPGAERKLTGKEEALLVATACASPPKGRARWTLKLMAVTLPLRLNPV
ncbi:hypothetical protein ACVWXO_001841 [Bradyrhizobium sp. LM2.7]